MNIEKSDIQKLINAIYENSDYDFSMYSENSFNRRIKKAVEEYSLSPNQLVNLIKKDNLFLENFVKYITVNTTEIFRDTETWKIYKSDILDDLNTKEEINIWHIGCSTGQEVYSNLILLNEEGLLSKSNVYATDINTDVLQMAKSGQFKYANIDEFTASFNKATSENKEIGNISIEKYFDIDGKKHTISVNSLLLNKIFFKKHDIISGTNPFNIKFDVIFCRNVLIYFNNFIQDKLHNFFYNNLNYNGYLIIGRYEGMISKISEKFEKKEVIYKKVFL